MAGALAGPRPPLSPSTRIVLGSLAIIVVGNLARVLLGPLCEGLGLGVEAVNPWTVLIPAFAIPLQLGRGRRPPRPRTPPRPLQAAVLAARARVAGLRGDTMIEYKGYVGKIAVDGGELYGTVMNLQRDHVDFRGSTVAELLEAFHDSVDFYLDGCRRDGEEPEKPILAWWPKTDP